MTISETARTEAADKASAMEDQLLALQRSVKFYEQFMKPANEQAPMQCFNVEAGLANNKITYGVSFMKNDQKDKDKLSFTVAFRVLAGAKVELLDPVKAAASPPLHERDANLTRDTRLTGNFKPGDEPLPEGLRLLDIKAYDNDNNVLAHCWKAF